MTWLFMGEQDDPELDVMEARGVPRIYDATRKHGPSPDMKWPRALAVSNAAAGLWLHQGGQWMRCGCGRCFYGPCLAPTV